VTPQFFYTRTTILVAVKHLSDRKHFEGFGFLDPGLYAQECETELAGFCIIRVCSRVRVLGHLGLQGGQGQGVQLHGMLVRDACLLCDWVVEWVHM